MICELTTAPETAALLDEADGLSHMRSQFRIPSAAGGGDQIYLVGNSLGAFPVGAEAAVVAELDRWANLGVSGHFEGNTAWVGYQDTLSRQMAGLVGAYPDEVVVMNTLTVNLHLMLISFYRPTPQRHKILIEERAFPSDHFAVESQIRQRGFDPAESLVIVKPRVGSNLLEPEDVYAAIREHGEQLATVALPGIQYFTGQVLPMAEITTAAHAVGATVGFNLAHAAGNVVMQLHDWGVDFATWCGYKYLNGGPGAAGGAFVHRCHVTDQALPKLLGWWGNNKETRFEMETVFDPLPTAESWQLSNGPILAMAPLRASLDLVDQAGGISALRHKSTTQIAYLDFLIDEMLIPHVELITPRQLDARGCQFSLRVTDSATDGQLIYRQLLSAGVACDWRYPDVIRVAPVPLYNSFTDIYRFVRILKDLVG